MRILSNRRCQLIRTLRKQSKVSVWRSFLGRGHPILVPPAKLAISSGKVALAVILLLTFAAVAYISVAPGPATNSSPTGQYTTVGSVRSTTSTVSTSTNNLVSSQTQTSQSSVTTSDLILEGGLSGAQKPGGFSGAPLNSSTKAEMVWNAPGLVSVYLHNPTGAIVFSKSASSGNYTFCVPTTGTYAFEMQSYSSQTGQWDVYVYEIRGSTCSPAG
jgi:hypothetical protein